MQLHSFTVLLQEVYTMRSVWKKSSHCYYNENGLHNIDVTWQPKRVDWNARVNSDDFNVLVSGGRRWCWLSTCTVWPSHSKWLSKHSNKSTSYFASSSNIPPQKLFGWFRRPQLWDTGDWQLHHNNTPAHASCLMQRYLVKEQITQVTQPPTAHIWCPVTFGFSKN